MSVRKKFTQEPLVDAPSGGVLIAVVGAASTGDVPTWDGTKYVPGAGGGAAASFIWMPLTTVVSGAPELVWDADDNLIPTHTPAS